AKLAKIADVSVSTMGKWAGSKGIMVLNVNGDSMDKIIPDGSLIAVKPVGLTELKNGDIVVFSNGYEYSVKRLQYHGKKNKRATKPSVLKCSFIQTFLQFFNDCTCWP